MIIEGLNLLIRTGVTSNITQDQIRKFIQRLNFTHIVNRGLDKIFRAFRAEDEATEKDIDADVEKTKEWLREKIGTTFNEATSPSDENLLGIDMSDWGGDRNAQQRRSSTPWAQMQRAMRDYREYVEQKLGDLCPWHHWQ